MPTYDYECEACGHAFERFQEITARKLRTCPKCKKRKLHRLIGSGMGVIFRGSGFYETDYKRAGSKNGGGKGSSSSSSPSSSSEGKGSDSSSSSSSSGSESKSTSTSSTSSNSGSKKSGSQKSKA